MFDDFLRNLGRFPSEQVIQVQVTLDDDGYYDRTCPAPECGARFKVLFEDWTDLVPDERAFCAVCREEAAPTEFDSVEQREHLVGQGLAHVEDMLDDVFRRSTPRSQDLGLVSMTLSYQRGSKRVVIPASAEPLMSQRSGCESCGCRYASVGAAFFCPACGHNSARTTFAGALATVRTSMDVADRLPSQLGRDAAADVARHLAEDGVVRLWSSFQRFAEVTYAGPARRNAFQNLDESDRLWRSKIGKTYADFLTSDEHRDLVVLVQARHVLSHREGIVDTDYIVNSGDQRYAVGQRLVVGQADVRRFAAILGKLASALPATKP
jgi:hypothetical protein